MNGLDRASALLGAGLLTCAGVSHATLLTFDETRSATGADVIPIAAGSTAPQDYGDFVTGSPMTVSGGEYTYGDDGEGFTPNIAVEYFSGSGVRVTQWTTGYGDLLNVIFAGALGSSAESLNVRLTADPGYLVELYAFDLAGWPSADYIIDGVTVTSEAGTLFSQPNVLVEGNGTGPRHTSLVMLTPSMGACR